jgi:tetratricopeptide (TPR) repeat protein
MRLNSTYVLNIVLVYHESDLKACEDIRRQLLQLHRRNKAYVINVVKFDNTDTSPDGLAMLGELLQAADLTLVLLSEASIMAELLSCNELRKAVDRQLAGKNHLLPIVLQTCWWEDTIYRHLETLPHGGMPLYENPVLEEQLLAQLLNDIQVRIDKIREEKTDNESTYKTVLTEADKLFEQAATQPALLRKALPLYREALEQWREGYAPMQEVLQGRVLLCSREINFYYYAEAAKTAYKKGDHETAYFNCKDALEMREDAHIRELFDQLDKQAKDKDQQSMREPFDRHLKRGHDFFLNMQWEEAKEEYNQALDFFEDDFMPTRESIQYKIETCYREATLEAATRKAKIYYSIQDYARVVDTLTDALRQINKAAFERIEHVMQLIRSIEHATPYHDAGSQRWGYMHQKTKEVIIAPKYHGAFTFSENLAGVKKWEKWGFIDVEGNEVIPFVYEFVGHFNRGVAEVVRGKNMFHINHRGDRVDEPTFKQLG